MALHHTAHHGHAARAIDYVLLPQVSGNGYYSYSPVNQQYGTQRTVDAIVDVGRQWMALYPMIPIGVGDMSFKGGAPMPPHHSHRDGKEVDIRPFRKDRRPGPTNIHSPDYDKLATGALVELLLSHSNVQTILFNDASLHGVKHWVGHDNHLHVKMRH